MEQEQVFTAVLKRAQSMGALIPIEQTAMDLGIQIVVKSIIFDSVKTIVGFEVIEDIPQGYMPARASLVDYENNITYSLIGIKTIESKYPFPMFLEFEPLNDISKIVVLTIEEIQIVNPGQTPLVRINTLNDPWDTDPDTSPEAVEKLLSWREELQREKEAIPPLWQCEGNWQFTIHTDFSHRSYYCKEYPCYIALPLLNQELKITKIRCGLAGCQLFCDSFNKQMTPEQLQEWHYSFVDSVLNSETPEEFAQNMQVEDIAMFRPMFFKITLESKQNGYVYPTTGSGPWGIFNTRFYYFCDSVEDPKDLEIHIDELFNIVLPEPWKFPLEIRDIDYCQEKPFNLDSMFVSANGNLYVDEIHYDPEYIILNHHMDITTGNINYIRLRDVRLIDKDGYSYQPIDKSSHWSEKFGKVLRGLTFPPVQYRGSEATLEVKSIDVAPIIPFKFAAVMSF